MRYDKKHGWTTTGFTLIEILVVIFIISLLASIVFFYGDYRTRARDIVRVHDMDTLFTGLTMYKLQYGFFPCSGFIQSTGDPNPFQFLVNKEVLTGALSDPINDGSPYQYAYSTFKEAPGGRCGAIVHLDIDFETESECLYGQFADGSTKGIGHCHSFFPHPPKCVNPWHFVNDPSDPNGSYDISSSCEELWDIGENGMTGGGT